MLNISSFFLKPILVTRGNTGKVYSPIKMLIYVQQTFIDENTGQPTYSKLVLIKYLYRIWIFTPHLFCEITIMLHFKTI